MSTPKLGNFEDLLAISVPALRPILLHLRQLILSIDPQAVEVVRLGDRAATYGVGPRKMKEGYVYILPYTAWVNLGFYQGANLSDPEQLLEGGGKKLRHIKIKNVLDLDRPAIRRLIQQAYEERVNATRE